VPADAYVILIVLYVLMHYMFVSQSAQVLALFGVFLDVAVRTGVPASLMTLVQLRWICLVCKNLKVKEVRCMGRP